jgi:hypothetical protein
LPQEDNIADLAFEQGPIRPPSEAYSLLVRFTRNCNWNQCLFCPVYKRRTFSHRPVEEVKADIDVIARIIEVVREYSLSIGSGGRVDQRTAQHFFERELSQSFLSVVAWLYHGTGAVFIQDANNLIVKADALVQMLEYLNEKVDGITRITSYARSRNAVRKTQEDLDRIRRAGLDRIHIGLESGSDKVLKFMKKGVTAAGHIEAGQKIVQAGMELSEYYMPGLGGRQWWREHALETARVINAINPHFIRLRSLRVPNRIPLFQKVESGEFEPLSDDETIDEIRLFIESLGDHLTGYVASDHIMNLLQDIEGRLPRDKQHMLDALDRYRKLPADQKIAYRLGRRMGLFHGVDDMARPELAQRVDQAREQIDTQYPGRIEDILSEMVNRMI